MSDSPPPPISERNPASLARYLLGFRWSLRSSAVHEGLVEGGLPLWVWILRFIPNPRQRGRALELGSPPYQISLLVRKLRNYDIEHTGFSVDGRPELVADLENPEQGERVTLTSKCFDVERDRFPYEDDTFDLVIWCEVIEHLTVDPMHTLSEIHRVLRTGGSLVVSTPNVARADNVATLFYGRNIYDPYHLGSPFAGSRHVREYTYQELRSLVEGCGFAIERMEDIDTEPAVGTRRKVVRFLLRRLIRRLTGGHYGHHLFVRATKTANPFRRNYPVGIFDAGHLALHLLIRDSRVVVGENDQTHTTMGWGEATTIHGRAARRASDKADVYVVSDRQASRVTITLRAGAGLARALHDKGGAFQELGSVRFEAGDEWEEVALALSPAYVSGTPVHIQFETHLGVDVHSIGLDESV
jgi:SAM-dependent methyltransferase